MGRSSVDPRINKKHCSVANRLNWQRGNLKIGPALKMTVERFVPRLFRRGLHSSRVFYRLFPRWTCDLNPTDIRDIPSGASGYQKKPGVEIFNYHTFLFCHIFISSILSYYFLAELMDVCMTSLTCSQCE